MCRKVRGNLATWCSTQSEQMAIRSRNMLLPLDRHGSGEHETLSISEWWKESINSIIKESRAEKTVGVNITLKRLL